MANKAYSGSGQCPLSGKFGSITKSAGEVNFFKNGGGS